MEAKLKKIIFASSIALDIIILDQFSKYWITNNLSSEIIILPNILSFVLHKNTGIAFSIPINGLILPLCVIIFLSYLLYKYSNKYFTNHKLVILVIGLIYGGSISNIIDRFIYSAVIDFISVYNFPVFNIADMAISAGAILIILFQNKIFKK